MRRKDLRPLHMCLQLWSEGDERQRPPLVFYGEIVMRNWKILKKGDRVRYEYHDFDGHGEVECTVVHVFSDHATAKGNGMYFTIDDDTRLMFTKMEEKKNV